MPIQTDAPSAMGTTCQWGLYGSAKNKLAALATNDGDTSITYAASGGAHYIERYTFPAIVGVTDPVTAASVTAVIRLYNRGGGGRELYWHWNSTKVGTNQATSVPTTYQYATLTYTASGAQLALASVNGEHGLEFNAAGGPSNKAEVWLTQLYRTVNYEYLAASAGDFNFLIGSIVGTLVGANLLLRDMPRLSSLMGSIRLRPDEYFPAWREWTEWRRPVYGV